MKCSLLSVALLITQVSAGSWQSPSTPSRDTAEVRRRASVATAATTYTYLGAVGTSTVAVAPRMPQINVEQPRIREVPQFDMHSIQSEHNNQIENLRNNFLRDNDNQARQAELRNQRIIQNQIRDIEAQVAQDAQDRADERAAEMRDRENDLRNQLQNDMRMRQGEFQRLQENVIASNEAETLRYEEEMRNAERIRAEFEAATLRCEEEMRNAEQIRAEYEASLIIYADDGSSASKSSKKGKKGKRRRSSGSRFRGFSLDDLE